MKKIPPILKLTLFLFFLIFAGLLLKEITLKRSNIRLNIDDKKVISIKISDSDGLKKPLIIKDINAINEVIKHINSVIIIEPGVALRFGNVLVIEIKYVNSKNEVLCFAGDYIIYPANGKYIWGKLNKSIDKELGQIYQKYEK